MHHFFYLFKRICLIFISIALNQEIISSPLKWSELPLSHKIKKNLPEQIYSKSIVKKFNKNKSQSLHLIVAGLHPKKCTIALSKISQYENYSKYIGFIKTSSYIEKTKQIHLHIAHFLMPFNMTLRFKIDRITEPGTYSFVFTNGFLKSLKGLIRVGKHKKRCLFLMEAKWKGPHSNINNTIFSFFLDALGQKFLNTLFRISRTM